MADLSYDETLRVLRASLVEAASNAWGFDVRARARPQLLTSRAWAELAEIEGLLARQLEKTLRTELRADPWSLVLKIRSRLRGLKIGLAGERNVMARLFADGRGSPIESWRAGAPQLERSLWPFFQDRTHHLANTLALALDEPAPFPPLLWHPGRRSFQH